MIWGKNQVGAVIDASIEWVAGPNEPEIAGQSNLTPTLGAQVWFQMEQDYPDKKLLSPAANISWLLSFRSEFIRMYGHPPRIDAVAHHCYGAWSTQSAISQCIASVNQAVTFAQVYDIPEVWVTEFAYLPCWPEGEQGSVEFMQAMVEHYKSVPEIKRWAYFQTSYYGTEPWSFGPTCNTSLVNIETGELTIQGQAYRELLYGEAYPSWR